jgi:hypothetical protein
MNSDEDKFYMKIVAFDEIYSFVVQNFFIWSNIVSQKMIYYQISILYPYLGSISFLPQDDFKWKKFELQSYRSHWKL